MLCCFTLVNLFKDLNETSGCNLRREHAHWTAHQIQFFPHSSGVCKGPNHEIEVVRVYSAWTQATLLLQKGDFTCQIRSATFGQQLQQIQSQRFGPGRRNG